MNNNSFSLVLLKSGIKANITSKDFSCTSSLPLVNNDINACITYISTYKFF